MQEDALARQFEDYLVADVEALRGRYNPTMFRRMVRERGGVGTAKLLLDSGRHTSYGFEKLWEIGELERSMEFAVLLPWFRDLFTAAEQDEAERRLRLHDFPVDERLAARSATPPAWFTGT